MSMSSTRRSYMAAKKLKVVCCAKTHRNCAAGHKFDGMSEANMMSERYTGGVTAVKNAAAWASCCISPSWNVSWLNSSQSNPMYNTHPKLYGKILGKQWVLYPRFYGNLK